nr:MAG: hypothetical protein [Bacteriophage sp.]
MPNTSVILLIKYVHSKRIGENAHGNPYMESKDREKPDIEAVGRINRNWKDHIK